MNVDEAGRAPGESHAIAPSAARTVAVTLKALAEPLRLRMLSFMATTPGGQACVCDLTALAEVSQPTVSHHLKVLRDVGILDAQRRGTWVWYSITPGYRAAVTTLLDAFAPVALDAHMVPRELTGLGDADAALDQLIGDMAASVPHVPFEMVQHTVRESYTNLACSARTAAHLIPLTERFARQRLADQTRDLTAGVPQVLFVCVANAGRSQLAAALARHYAGERVVVRSAGSMPAAEVQKGVRDVLADLGVGDVDEQFPKPLTDDAIRAADVVVTMGCGDVCPIVPGIRYEEWRVGDPALASPAGIAAICTDLDARVRALLADLLPDLALPDPRTHWSTS